MVSGHELLLIVRAQNQASAAIGRVARDLRTLETRRALAMQRQANAVRQLRLSERVARNAARVESLNTGVSAERHRVEQASNALTMRRLNLQDRIMAAEDAQLAVEKQRTNVELRNQRLMQGQLAIQTKMVTEQARLDTLQRNIPVRLGKIRAETDKISLAQSRFNLATRRMQRQIAVEQATRRVQAAEVSPTGTTIVARRLQIAKRQLEALSFEEQKLGQVSKMLGVRQAELAGVEAQHAARIRASKETIAGYVNALEINRGEISKLTAEYDILDSRQVRNANRLRELDLALKNTATEEGRLTLAIKAEGAAIAEAAAESVRLVREQQVLLAQTTELNYALKIQSDQRWAAISRSITHTGRVMQLFGLVATASMGYAAKSAADFNTEITRAATQARKPGATVQSTIRLSGRLMDQVLKQMQQFPATSQEMADSLYEIFSGTNVQSIGKAAAMLRTFNMMAVAGQTDLQTMTDAGISLYNNFRSEFPNMTAAANAFFAAVRFGRMDASQFAGSLSNILPIAKEAGLRFSDVADAMATLTRQSGARFTSRDATGLARLIQVMTRPEMIRGLHQMGVEVEDSHKKMRPLIAILGDLRKAMDLRGIKPGPETLNLFKTISAAGGGGASRGFQGTIQAQRVFAFLINNMKSYHTVAGQVNSDNDEFIKSFRALRQTPGVQFQIFVNQVKALVIVIGQGAIPALMGLAQWIQRLVHWFNSLSPETRRTIGYFTAIASVGTLVIGVLGSMVGSVMSVVFGLKLLAAARAATALEATASSAGLLASEAAFSTPQVMLLMGALVALGAVYYKYPQQTKAVIAYTKELIGQLIQLDIQLTNLVTHPWEIIISPKFKLPKQLEEIMGLKRFRQGLHEAAKTIPGVGVLVQVMDLFKLLGRANQQPFRNIKTQPMSDVAMSLKKVRAGTNETAMATAQAAVSNVKATKTFVQLYRALLQAIRELDKHPTSIKAQFRYQTALQNLQDNVSAQQYKAAKAAANATSKVQQRFSDDSIKREYLRVLQLEKIAKRTNTLAAWKQYYAAQNKLQNRASSVQMSALDAVYAKNDSAQKVFSDRTVRREFRRVQQLEKAAKRSNTFAAWRKYYDALGKLQAHATSAQMQALDALGNNAKKNSKKIGDAAQREFETLLSNTKNMYDNFLQQNQAAFGQLFQGPYIQSAIVQDRLNWGGMLTKTDLFKDLKQQFVAFENWRRRLNRLRRRGAPEELIGQIAAMGPQEAGKALQLLNQMSPRELARYVALWKKSQVEIHKAAMIDTRNQIKHYERFGKQVARAIIAGIKSENPHLEDTLKEMLVRMFPQFAKQAAKRGTPRRTGQLGKPEGKPNVTNNHTHYHVTAPKSEHPTIKQQLGDANWHHRTAKKKP